MTNLRRFHLTKDRERDDWVLKEEGAQQARRRFETKQEALHGLRGVVEPKGGSVRIHTENGVFQEERTYPRRDDPTKSKG